MQHLEVLAVSAFIANVRLQVEPRESAHDLQYGTLDAVGGWDICIYAAIAQADTPCMKCGIDDGIRRQAA